MDVPYLSCNYPSRRRTSCRTRKLLDRIIVGFQLYSARTFHVTLSPRIYKGGHVRPGAAGLLISIEYSRVRDRSWMYLTSLVTTRVDVELVAERGNYPIVL